MFPHEQFKKRNIGNDEFYLSKNEFLPIRDKRVFQIINYPRIFPADTL